MTPADLIEKWRRDADNALTVPFALGLRKCSDELETMLNVEAARSAVDFEDLSALLIKSASGGRNTGSCTE